MPKRSKDPTIQKAGESMEKYYKRLVKAYNRRLDRLEELAQQDKFHGATDYAYKKAMYDIHSWDKSADRMTSKIPASEKTMLAKLNAMKRFILSPTSSKSGIKNIYIKRTKTLNKNHGTNFTWQQLAEFFEQGGFERFNKKYGDSMTQLEIIANIQKVDPEILKALSDIDDKKDAKSFLLKNGITDPIVASKMYEATNDPTLLDLIRRK